MARVWQLVKRVGRIVGDTYEGPRLKAESSSIFGSEFRDKAARNANAAPPPLGRYFETDS